MNDMIDPTGVPMAHRTSWAITPEGVFVLVLEDKDGKPIAAATYTWPDWMTTFQQLIDVHNEREAKR